MNGTADIIDGTWRPLLTRDWSDGPQVAFIMLNPSIADATRPDPTLTRCIGFAQSWGMGGLRVANLWSMVQSDPTQLWRAWAADYRDAVGPDNDAAILRAVDGAACVVVAWGAFCKCPARLLPAAATRARRVAHLLRTAGVTPMCLGTTSAGWPRHPLYLRSDTPREPWVCP